MSKSISINPAFFKISGRSALKKQKKRKPLMSAKTLKPNDVKKKLIAKIKEHQKREKEKIMDEQKKQEKVFQDDFKNTLSYLEEVKKKNIKKKRKKKEKNKTLKRPNVLENTNIPVSTEINTTSSNIPIHLEPMGSPNKLDKEPPYGCLKGGSKPTWRQWNKTLKKNPDDKEPLFNLSIDFQNNNNKFQERQAKLHQLKHKFQTPPPPKTHKIRTRRIRKKITLGKVGKKVGVLVKNKKTRKIIKNEIYTLKKKSIQEVKDYLRKHNLVKIGSNAPDHIFRSIYENAYLSGDIKNKNPDILLHNWHKDEEE